MTEDRSGDWFATHAGEKGRRKKCLWEICESPKFYSVLLQEWQVGLRMGSLYNQAAKSWQLLHATETSPERRKIKEMQTSALRKKPTMQEKENKNKNKVTN